MAFDGTEGQSIELGLASEWTANFRAQNPNEIKAHFFGKDIINTILSQDGCMGIRIYYALNDEGVPQLILVGADSEENDMVDGELADVSMPCPTYCSKPNSLNSDL